MRARSRPQQEPPELIQLRRQRSYDFGPMGCPLDKMFQGVCALCERTAKDNDVVKRKNGFFYCDHFRPRHRFPDLIYDWSNLIYLCGECADVKGGQWPRLDDPANQWLTQLNFVAVTEYVDPIESPNDFFTFDVESGEIEPRNAALAPIALRMIGDLALNDPEELAKIPDWQMRLRQQRPDHELTLRKSDLALQRRQTVNDLDTTLEKFSDEDPVNHDLLEYIVRQYTHPSARFSSICTQFIENSEKFRRYLGQ